MPDHVFRARIGQKQIEVRPTLLDRAIDHVWPQLYQRRMQSRFMMAAASAGGYTQTPRKRRQLGQWSFSDGDADADILPDLEDLRGASADLARNNPIAAGAIKTKVTSIIGAGLTLNAQIDREFLKLDDKAADALELALQREWALFAATSECDIERQSTFAQQTKMVCHGMLTRGDIFAITPMIGRAGAPYETKIQLIEADRVSNPGFADDTDEISGGVERGPSGDFSAIHVTDKHPGSIKSVAGVIGARNRRRSKNEFTWQRIHAFGESGRRNVLHIFDKERPGQSRGVPDLAAIIEPLKQIGRYTDAEIAAAVVSGMFTVFVKTEAGGQLQPMQPVGDSKASDADEDYKLMNGGIVGLLPGEDVTAPNPGRPNDSFDPFMRSILTQIGMALQLPFELLVKRFESSYSAARAAVNEAWKYFITTRELIADNWCQPIYEIVIEEAVLKGRIAAPGFLADPAVRRAYLGAMWVGPGRLSINEAVEVKAAIERVNANLSTKGQETAALNGGDYETNARTRRREVEMERELGIVPPEQSKAAAAPAQPMRNAPPPGDDEDEEDEQRKRDDEEDERDEQFRSRVNEQHRETVTAVGELKGVLRTLVATADRTESGGVELLEAVSKGNETTHRQLGKLIDVVAGLHGDLNGEQPPAE